MNKKDVKTFAMEVLKVASPLTALIMEVAEMSVTKSIDVTKNGDIEEMKAEVTRQEIATRIAEAQAKVAQELSIANRIDNANEVTIEEFYDVSGDANVGLNFKENGLNAGINGSGKKVTKRIYRFKGFREDDSNIEEVIQEK